MTLLWFGAFLALDAALRAQSAGERLGSCIWRHPDRLGDCGAKHDAPQMRFLTPSALSLGSRTAV